ncbi:MAG: glutathione S-transferase family protein [Hyphomonadaceae bacterium]
MGYVLIGAEASQFSAKARACLRWKGVDVAERDATPEVYRDVIEPRIGYAVIPVLLTPDEQIVQDSAEIIDHIDAATPGPSAHPPTPLQEFVSRLIELYADEWLVIAGLHYRWAYNDAWMVSEFGRTAAPNATPQEQAAIGEVLAAPARERASRVGVSEDTASGIEAHYEGFLADFSEHLRRQPFVLGGRPSLADFALYGVLQAVLLRDPESGAHMRRLAPAVVAWIGRVEAARAGQGDLLPEDEIPATLLPILKRQVSEQFPVLADSARALEAWSAAQPSGARIKRQLGTHEFMIGGRWGQRSIFTFPLWRLQRIQDHYKAMEEDDRQRADQLLASVGGRGLMDLRIPVRIARRDFRLVIA